MLVAVVIYVGKGIGIPLPVRETTVFILASFFPMAPFQTIHSHVVGGARNMIVKDSVTSACAHGQCLGSTK